MAVMMGARAGLVFLFFSHCLHIHQTVSRSLAGGRADVDSCRDPHDVDVIATRVASPDDFDDDDDEDDGDDDDDEWC